MLEPDHVLFRFEKTLYFGQAEFKLVDQLCLQLGFRRTPGLYASYLAGEDTAMCDFFPELVPTSTY
jgi:hypothetical protein